MTVAGEMATRLDALQRRHAPDRRLAVWEVTLEEPEGEPARLTGAVSESDALRDLEDLGRQTGLPVAVALLPASGIEVQGIAHRSLAHLRAEPRHSAELVSQMLLGEEALVLRERGEWLQVQTADRYVAWVHRRSIVRRAPEDLDAFRARLFERRPPAGRWIVTARARRAIREPAPFAAPVADLVQGAIVEVAETRGRFLEVVLPDGATGWVGRGDLAPADRLAERFTPSGRAILEHGAQFLGLPYLWGGTSEKGFDCSGFVQRLFGLHGTWLPRDSDQQSACGDPVDVGAGWSGVADGDLAFFSERDDGRSTHVGILADGGRLLHASTSRNGVAWEALSRSADGHDEYAARLAASLTTVRRLPPVHLDPTRR
jgi:cell wall-associated NlpC family hydrolase